MAAYYNEIDPYAAQWLRNLIAADHIAPGEVDERSIDLVDPLDLLNDADSSNRAAGWGALGVAIVLALLAARFLYLFVAGINDAFVTTTVEGEVLRERTRGSDEKIVHWVALDTGKPAIVHAWRVVPARAQEVRQHEVVRARVTPLLGFVRSFEPVPVTSN